MLSIIHENHDYIPVKPNIILQLHRDLYKYSGMNFGGNYKSADNIIAETLQDGTRRVRLKPIDAGETRSNYIVGKYISIEKIIEKSKETYYETG